MLTDLLSRMADFDLTPDQREVRKKPPARRVAHDHGAERAQRVGRVAAALQHRPHRAAPGDVDAAVELRHVIPNEWSLLLSGLLSVLFGVLLLVQPGGGALAVVWVVGFYAVLFGIGMLAFAWRLRGLHEHVSELTRPLSQAKPA